MAQWYIKEFSKLSNISVRTLRHYDDIGLLTPSIRLPNGYRLYSETDLLRLQQIIALKFFGFKLTQVQVLLKKDLDILDHFRAQQQTIQNQMIQLENANCTIATIIEKLESNRSIEWNNIIQLIEDYRMSKETKMIWGPDLDKQDEYQQQLVDFGLATQEQIEAVNEKAKSWPADKVLGIKHEQEALLKALSVALNNHKLPGDKEVQIQIRRHYETIKNFYTPNKESYIKIAEFYSRSPDFKQYISTYHPKLMEYLAAAMKIFAERELS